MSSANPAYDVLVGTVEQQWHHITILAKALRSYAENGAEGKDAVIKEVNQVEDKLKGMQDTFLVLNDHKNSGGASQEIRQAAREVAEQVFKENKKGLEDSGNKSGAELAAVTKTLTDLEGRFNKTEQFVAEEFRKMDIAPADGQGGDAMPVGRFRQSGRGGDSQILKKVSTRLQDFEAQITAQMSNMQNDFDKKISHTVRSQGGMKTLDSGDGHLNRGIESIAEDLDAMKYDVGELKDLLTNNKGEVNHVRRIVLACERDMEDFTAAMDAVNVDLDEMRARVDATHSIITSRQRVEATMTAEISTMRLDIGDIQEALKNHDSWMEDVSSTLQQMQEKEENLTEDIINLKNEMNSKLDTKVDNVAWKEANDDLDAAIKTVRDMVSSLRLDVDARRRKVDEILATIRHDITAVETNLEESKAKITADTDQAVNALNGRIDFTNKDLAATQESLHTTQNSLSDCFNEVAVVRSDLERNVADTEARLKSDIRQKQQEAFEKIGSVEQSAELRSAEASRRLGALDLRMSGVQGGLGEHKRDILKLRDEVNGLTVKSATHEVDIAKNNDSIRKLEKQRNADEQNWKAQMDAVHDVLDTKVNEKPFEDVKHSVAALTKGVVKFAQVVGVFPGPRFDDGDTDQTEADVELLGWEECAENMAFRVDKAWRQRCSQRFRNILDMIAKKADHSVLRLLQISQQHIESQLERVKHERELWKEVVERRQQQPLQLALTLKENAKTDGLAAISSPQVGGEPKPSPLSKRISRPMTTQSK